MPLPSIHEGAKGLGAQPLFSGLHFELRPGFKVGLVGANGSGKTTLLRLLGSQYPRSRGAAEATEVEAYGRA